MLGKEILKLEKAVGEGRSTPIYEFILCKEGRYYATNGSVCASVPAITIMPPAPFCVRYSLLTRAAEQVDAEIIGINHNISEVKVRFKPRGRMTLKMIDPDSFPFLKNDQAQWHDLPAEFPDVLRALAPFRGDGAVSTWNSAIHFGEDFAFAANSSELARYEWRGDGQPRIPVFTVAPWLATFITSQDDPPSRVGIGERLTSFVWLDGTTITLEIHGRNLDDDAPEAYWGFAEGVGRASAVIPEGFKEAVARIDEHGAKVMKIGNDFISADLKEGDLHEEFEIVPTWLPSLWGPERMLRALKHASHLDLDGATKRATWRGPRMRGLMMGMSG